MLLKKPLILTLAVAFSVHCPKGHAQESRLSLLFALGVGKTLIEWHHFDMPRICFGDDILLKPAPRYCFFLATGVSPDSGVEAKAHSRAASDEGSEPEDNGTSDENSDNLSEEDETDTETNVQCVNTTSDPFRALNEFSEVCATLRLKMINQNSTSDTEIATGSELIHPPADQRPKKTKVHQCDHEGCNYNTRWASYLKRHKQTHLPANQRLTAFQCDNDGCNYSTNHAGNLKRHKQTHLPVDQRPIRTKVHQCDHEGCNYRTDHRGSLKKHKRTHLPDDQRLWAYRCDHKGCNYSTDYGSNLKRHIQTHLPTDLRPKRPKVHQCDHEGCNYSAGHTGHLKMHKQTHLPADQRLKVHQCSHEDCNYSTDRVSNLKTHQQTHLPADQRPKKPKRKAYDQPPSNKKRKKGDKK
ncbi:C2H2-type zinc finger protein [Endozoicomonas sp. 4G]|uniref:C2H2-type zinc finger protein n=1 Tax=Endozoicomonas sp. 4G TaxID=2872754 RepID=UPI002078ED47|nr:C2H2-type zinc finger protein [Endozoicomonas sp. 4G]